MLTLNQGSLRLGRAALPQASPSSLRARLSAWATGDAPRVPSPAPHARGEPRRDRCVAVRGVSAAPSQYRQGDIRSNRGRGLGSVRTPFEVGRRDGANGAGRPAPSMIVVRLDRALATAQDRRRPWEPGNDWRANGAHGTPPLLIWLVRGAPPPPQRLSRSGTRTTSASQKRAR